MSLSEGEEEEEEPRQRRNCFVTVGATANFDALIKAVLSPPFLKALQTSDYTDLVLQHGKGGGKIFQDFAAENPPNSKGRYGLDIIGFGFNKAGLDVEMRAAKGKGNAEGIVISHAGSGSILAALRVAVPIVVVPNPDLLDNHQAELAAVLAKQGYVVHGRLDDLAASILQSEILKKKNAWPPVSSGYDPSGRGLIGVMDDEMGFVD